MSKTKQAAVVWLAAISLAVSIPVTVLMLKPTLSSVPEIKQPVLSMSESIAKVTWLVRTSHGSGSGVAITLPGGSVGVLTAAHVVGGEVQVVLMREARGPNGVKSVLMIKGEVVKRWAEWDLALIQPAAPELLENVSLLDSAEVKVGDDLLHAGSQFGSEFGLVVLRGYAIGRDYIPNRLEWPWKHALDATDIHFRPGSSGGGVFNSRGGVVGICVGAATCGLGVYVPTRDILPLLQ